MSVDFWTVSLVELLDDSEAKTLLGKAQEQFEKRDYAACLISCRKAFYVVFEHWYDIRNNEDSAGIMFSSWAPHFTRDAAWRERNVRTPFDNIYLDRDRIGADLTKEGIDHTAFWNVWRLTPQVYRRKKEDEWIVQHDLAQMNEEGLMERTAYVLENTTTILLTKQANQRATRFVGSGDFSTVKVKIPKTKIYEKADKASKVVVETPDTLKELPVDFATVGLNDKDIYWHVWLIGTAIGSVLDGFVLQDDLQFE